MARRQHLVLGPAIWAVLGCTVVVAGLTMTLGTTAAVRDILHDTGESGVFACFCEGQACAMEGNATATAR